MNLQLLKNILWAIVRSRPTNPDSDQICFAFLGITDIFFAFLIFTIYPNLATICQVQRSFPSTAKFVDRLLNNELIGTKRE